MVKVGDQVQIAGRKLGEAPREGAVKAVSGSLLRIRWASGEESSLIPGPGTMTVIGSKRTAAKKGSVKRSTAKKTASKRSPAAAKKSTTKTALQKKATGKPKKAVTKKTATKKKGRR